MKSIAALILLATIACCGSVSAQHNLEGIWTVDFNEVMKGMTIEQRVEYDSLPGRIRDNLKNAFHGRQFIFSKENDVSISYKVKEVLKTKRGTWLFNEETQTLSVTADGVMRQFDVRWEDSNRIRLGFKDPAPKALLKLLYLVRN